MPTGTWTVIKSPEGFPDDICISRVVDHGDDSSTSHEMMLPPDCVVVEGILSPGDEVELALRRRSS